MAQTQHPLPLPGEVNYRIHVCPPQDAGEWTSTLSSVSANTYFPGHKHDSFSAALYFTNLTGEVTEDEKGGKYDASRPTFSCRRGWSGNLVLSRSFIVRFVSTASVWFVSFICEYMSKCFTYDIEDLEQGRWGGIK